MSRQRIQRVSPKKLTDVIDCRTPRGLFLTKEGRKWVAVDNTTGDAWTEDFDCRCQAIRWLRGKFEVGDSAKDWIDINTPDQLVTAAMRQGMKMSAKEADVVLGYLEGHDFCLRMDANGNTVRHDMQHKSIHRGDEPYTIREVVWFCQEMNEELLNDALSHVDPNAEYLSELRQSEQILDVLAARIMQSVDARDERRTRYACISS